MISQKKLPVVCSVCIERSGQEHRRNSIGVDLGPEALLHE